MNDDSAEYHARQRANAAENQLRELEARESGPFPQSRRPEKAGWALRWVIAAALIAFGWALRGWFG